MISTTTSVSAFTFSRTATAVAPPPPQEQAPVERSAGKSADSVGHRAKAAVGEAREAGHALPKNVQGIAASAIAKGLDPAQILAALNEADVDSGEIDELAGDDLEIGDIDDNQVIGYTDAEEMAEIGGDLGDDNAIAFSINFLQVSFAAVSSTAVPEPGTSGEPAAGSPTDASGPSGQVGAPPQSTDQIALLYTSTSVAISYGANTSAENALDLLT